MSFSLPFKSNPKFAILLMACCFVAQTFLLPVFIYSFIFAIIIIISSYSKKLSTISSTPLSSIKKIPLNFRILFSLALIFPVLAKSVSATSLLFFITSLLCICMVFLIDKNNPKLKTDAAICFIFLCVFSVVTGILWKLSLNPERAIFMLDRNQNIFRFRSINLEPNHLGFALCAAYTIIIYDPSNLFKDLAKLRTKLLLALWALVIMTLSPFALGMMVVISFPYLLKTRTGKIICLALILVAIAVTLKSARVAQILSGEDSSANLRTWGSFVIAYSQIENCGFMGCGIGNSRNILADEPLMAAFAAEESLVLPNLMAGSIVEGGYPLLFFVLYVIWIAAFPKKKNKVECFGISTASFLLLLLYSASGSYVYDPQFWSTTGLLAGLVRKNEHSEHAA